MTKSAISGLLFLLPLSIFSQSPRTLEPGKEYKDLALGKTDSLGYFVRLNKGGIYQFAIEQQGIAVYYALTDAGGHNFVESNYPDDIVGVEKFEFEPATTGTYFLKVRRFDDPENPETGRLRIFIKELSAVEIKVRRQIKKELDAENRKNVTTIDIDHFWQAYDNLKNCNSLADSISNFQSLYLDRATNGFLDFIQARELTAEKFIEALRKYPAFYQSIRSNTLAAKKAEPAVQEVFTKFYSIYPEFKPFKVCFAIGIKNTGGTVSNEYVLIGTEVTASFGNKDTVSEKEIIERIKLIVAHECVHTQQPLHPDSNAIRCPLLYQSIREGACDFIAEMVTGISRSSEYGRLHERELWTAFKNELCNTDIGNWLYNAHASKEKPSDLGYYIGYEISRSYYSGASDKGKAITEIIGMSDPLQFLQLSRYDQKHR